MHDLVGDELHADLRDEYLVLGEGALLCQVRQVLDEVCRPAEPVGAAHGVHGAESWAHQSWTREGHGLIWLDSQRREDEGPQNNPSLVVGMDTDGRLGLLASQARGSVQSEITHKGDYELGKEGEVILVLFLKMRPSHIGEQTQEEVHARLTTDDDFLDDD